MAAIDQLLLQAYESRASDLQLIAGSPPVFRIDGEVAFTDADPLSADRIRQLAAEIMSQEQRTRLADVGDVDFA